MVDREAAGPHPASRSRHSFRPVQFITPLLTALIVIAIIGGIITSYHLSKSAERESSLAIRAFDLHGDISQIAGDLALPNADQTIAIQRDTSSAIAGARQGIGEMSAAGRLTPLLRQAIAASTTYLDVTERSIIAVGAGSAVKLPVALSPDAVVDLVDRAATEAELAADQSARDSRIGELAALLFVVLFVVVGGLWGARRRRHAAVSASQAEGLAQFEAMVENSSDLFFLTNDADRTVYCSPPAARFFGMSAAEVCAASLDQLVHPDDLDVTSDAFATVRKSGVAGPLDVRLRHGDGGWRTLEFSGNDLSLTSTVQAAAWHLRDVTDRRALEEQLARQAFEDPLTGLANRALFRDRLGHALARNSRSVRAIAVLMLDLDGFKAINDSLGHDAGDEALKEVAARIRRSARPGDTVARLGGDEFTVLLEEIDDPAFVDEVADRILELIRQPLTVHGVVIRVSASIGIVVSSDPGLTPESLLRDADIAMYTAKTNGRDRRARFEPAMHARAALQLHFSQDLASALDRHELIVYYQPSVELRGGQPDGFEALLRWNHRDLGLIQPTAFIPIAEQNGLIVPIGRWVLEQACEQAVAWRSEFPAGDALTMSVNVSGRQLNHESLIPDVRQILHDSGFEPANLILEVTESVLMTDIDAIVSRLKELKDLGITIAIDDFGTGYSSLAYLRQLPIDILKIDKTFVDAASAGDPGADAIMRAIVDLSAGLQLKTIAEGVENTSQALHIKELGCDSAQGYLFSRPLPPDELRAFFAANTPGKHPVLA